MEAFGVGFGRRIAPTLSSAYVQQHGGLESLGRFQVTDKLADIVSVDGAYVVEMKGFK